MKQRTGRMWHETMNRSVQPLHLEGNIMGYHSYFTGSMTLDTTNYTGTLDDLKQVILDNGAREWKGFTDTFLSHPFVIENNQVVKDDNGEALPNPNSVYVCFDGIDTCRHYELNKELVQIATAVQALEGIRVDDLDGTRDGEEDDDFEQFEWVNGTVHSSYEGLLTEEPIDMNATVESLVDSDSVTEFLEQRGVPKEIIALVELGKRLGNLRDSGVFTESELTALADGLPAGATA